MSLPRNYVYPTPPRLSGRMEVAALRRDVDALAGYAQETTRIIHDVYDILSRRMNDMLQSGTLADRPAAGQQNRVYFASDQAVGARFYYDAGAGLWLAP